MKNFFIKIFLWVYIKIHTAFINLSFAMRDESLKNVDVDERKKFNKRWIRSQLLQKFEAGQRDEKYVQDYYELLKKADNFMKNATPHKKAIAADKNAMNLGRKDRHGRRLDHIGFFAEGHKHHGKTLAEVMEQEMNERKTTDDDYEILTIFNNEPIEGGLTKITDAVDQEFKTVDLANKSKSFEFPMKVTRDNPNAVNKIEQLTQYLHVKKIGFEHRQLEFFIPKKFKLGDVDSDSNIFKEIINIKQVYFNNDYGELIGFSVVDFTKRISVENFEVLKFHAIEMETINTY